MIGEGGLLNALNEVRYTITREPPDYVIVGEGRVLNYELVGHAHGMIGKCAHLISTNADTWCPTDLGPRPGCGAIVALLEAASGRKAHHVGKSNPFILRAARKRIGSRTDEVIMIGDLKHIGAHRIEHKGNFETISVPPHACVRFDRGACAGTRRAWAAGSHGRGGQ